MKNDFDLIKKSRNALDEMYLKYGESDFLIQELTDAGFEMDAQFADIKFNEKEDMWFRICDYAYQPTSAEGKVRIKKLKENGVHND